MSEDVSIGASGDVAASDATRAENAKLAFEQTLLLWEDQVAYADTLRDKRRTYSAGIAILFGLGMFRLEWSVNPTFVRAVPSSTVEVCIKAMLGLAAAFMLMALYFLYTERALVSDAAARSVRAAARAGIRWAGRRGIGRMIWRGSKWLVRTIGWCRQSVLGFTVKARGDRAVLALRLRPKTVDQLIAASTENVWRFRQARLALAHERLVLANTRVSQRIRVGVLYTVGGYALTLVALVWYTWARQA